MSLRCHQVLIAWVAGLGIPAAWAEGTVTPTDAYLDQTRPRWEQVSRQIWDFAETALQ